MLDPTAPLYPCPYRLLPPCIMGDIEEALVTFTKSKVTAKWLAEEDLSILQLAEKNGLKPAFGCRSAICGTCEVKLLKGQVYGPEGDYPKVRNFAYKSLLQRKDTYDHTSKTSMGCKLTSGRGFSYATAIPQPQRSKSNSNVTRYLHSGSGPDARSPPRPKLITLIHFEWRKHGGPRKTRRPVYNSASVRIAPETFEHLGEARNHGIHAVG